MQKLVYNNFDLLLAKLQKIDSFKTSIESVIIDGSFIRGDFLDDNSDIDITFTTVNKDVSLNLKDGILSAINEAQMLFPKRVVVRKPLFYDVQWQDLETVLRTGNRKIEEWNIDTVPSGYPKLWLYAFDSITHHLVLYGNDVTEHYTRICPSAFVPIRLQRLRRAVLKIKGKQTEYERIHGGVTQIKNAWETVRALCLESGLASLKKDDVYSCSKDIFLKPEHLGTIDALWNYFHQSSNINMDTFRKNLYHFTIDVIGEFS